MRVGSQPARVATPSCRDNAVESKGSVIKRDFRRIGRAGENAFERLPARRAARRQDPIMGREIARRDLAQTRQRMPPPHHHRIGIGEQELFVDVARPVRAAQHPEQKVEASAAKVVEQRFVAPAQDLNDGVRVEGEKLVERGRQEMRIRMRDIADGDARGNDALRRLHLVDAVLDFPQRDLETAGELASLPGRRDAVHRPLIERAPEHAFEVARRAMQRGLGYRELARRPLEGTAIRDRDQAADMRAGDLDLERFDGLAVRE